MIARDVKIDDLTARMQEVPASEEAMRKAYEQVTSMTAHK
jgi:hypothetical protein